MVLARVWSVGDRCFFPHVRRSKEVIVDVGDLELENEDWNLGSGAWVLDANEWNLAIVHSSLAIGTWLSDVRE